MISSKLQGDILKRGRVVAFAAAGKDGPSVTEKDRLDDLKEAGPSSMTETDGAGDKVKQKQSTYNEGLTRQHVKFDNDFYDGHGEESF